MRTLRGVGIVVGAWLCGPAGAEALPMAAHAGLLSQAAPLVSFATRAPARGPSLFVGRGAEGLFAPMAQTTLRPLQAGPKAGRVAELRSLIAKAEAGPKGYDAVQYGARIKPPAPPTNLTVAQIYAWIDDTPGQPHAIGRYQFIPPTLKRLMTRAGVDPSARFTPRLQDRLADILLVEAGLHDALAGTLPRHSFMNNLAKIWAGLPNDTGRSHYHGYAGNKATMTWARFDAEMSRIFPG